MLENIPVEIKILDSRIKNSIPSYGSEHAAAVDIHACIDQAMQIQRQETKLINSGFAINIKNPNYVAIIVPRSGLGHKHGLVLGNLVGVIDADYQGEVKISIWNRSNESYIINPMDRIAQMMVVPVSRIDWKIVDEFETSKRGEGGFGSTGIDKTFAHN